MRTEGRGVRIFVIAELRQPQSGGPGVCLAIQERASANEWTTKNGKETWRKMVDGTGDQQRVSRRYSNIAVHSSLIPKARRQTARLPQVFGVHKGPKTLLSGREVGMSILQIQEISYVHRLLVKPSL